ncbi:hypothetical protein BB561_001240 [Smittium simulii]|uniref:PIN domain-containing protein n=1 Tax=Smittium simulii TaxID=133385 RepID=A0A2T9YVK0_9FUNG|nr:hypothetical protein BB561_001240 [Smittium simulii]
MFGNQDGMDIDEIPISTNYHEDSMPTSYCNTKKENLLQPLLPSEFTLDRNGTPLSLYSNYQATNDSPLSLYSNYKALNESLNTQTSQTNVDCAITISDTENIFKGRQGTETQTENKNKNKQKIEQRVILKKKLGQQLNEQTPNFELSLFDQEKRKIGTKTALNITTPTVGKTVTPKPAHDIKYSIVVDTNYLISDLALIKNIVQAISNSSFRLSIQVVIPWVVIGELDNLNKKAYSKNRPKQEPTSKKAKNAIIYLKDILDAPEAKNVIRGQKVNERLISQVEANLVVEDDLILDCCRYLMEFENKNVTLMSLDKNLLVKAKIHDIYTIEHWHTGAINILEHVQKHSANSNPKPNNAQLKPSFYSGIRTNSSELIQPIETYIPVGYKKKHGMGGLNVKSDARSINGIMKSPARGGCTSELISPIYMDTCFNQHTKRDIIEKTPVKKNFNYNSVELADLTPVRENGSYNSVDLIDLTSEKRKIGYNSAELIDLTEGAISTHKRQANSVDNGARTYADLMVERKILSAKSTRGKSVNKAIIPGPTNDTSANNQDWGDCGKPINNISAEKPASGKKRKTGMQSSEIVSIEKRQKVDTISIDSSPENLNRPAYTR